MMMIMIAAPSSDFNLWIFSMKTTSFKDKTLLSLLNQMWSSMKIPLRFQIQNNFLNNFKHEKERKGTGDDDEKN